MNEYEFNQCIRQTTRARVVDGRLHKLSGRTLHTIRCTYLAYECARFGWSRPPVCLTHKLFLLCARFFVFFVCCVCIIMLYMCFLLFYFRFIRLVIPGSVDHSHIAIIIIPRVSIDSPPHHRISRPTHRRRRQTIIRNRQTHINSAAQ